jgi:hypothetical protein
MYLGLAFVYLGIAIAGQSIWALILLPVVLLVVQRGAIEPEEAFLERRLAPSTCAIRKRELDMEHGLRSSRIQA